MESKDQPEEHYTLVPCNPKIPKQSNQMELQQQGSDCAEFKNRKGIRDLQFPHINGEKPGQTDGKLGVSS